MLHANCGFNFHDTCFNKNWNMQTYQKYIKNKMLGNVCSTEFLFALMRSAFRKCFKKCTGVWEVALNLMISEKLHQPSHKNFPRSISQYHFNKQ
jgi:hypothetical protein